jgi:hypothetical protein
VSRYGDTLILRFANGRTRTHVDDVGREGMDVERYEGMVHARAGLSALHVLQIAGEAGGYRLIDAVSGAQVEVPGYPIMSPDSARFATPHEERDVCWSTHQFSIWRFTRQVPEREWSAKALRCDGQPEWAVENPVWRSSDTLLFARMIYVQKTHQWQRDSMPSFLVRTPAGWVLDSGTTAALASPSLRP